MNVEALEARKQEIENELNTMLLNQHRLQGAIAILDELILKAQEVLGEGAEDDSGAEPTT